MMSFNCFDGAKVRRKIDMCKYFSNFFQEKYVKECYIIDYKRVMNVRKFSVKITLWLR